MGNLVQRTTDTRKAADKASRLSLESDIIELTEQANADVAEVAEASGQIAEATTNIDQSITGADSLSALVDNTVAIYGEQGIPEDAAKQLEVSVEAVLRVMGHPGSFASVLPSFESCATPAQYSTEAEEKKNGVVGRIWEWIKKIYGQMVEFFTGMIDKVRNSTKSLSALTTKLSEKVGELKETNGEGTVSLGGYGKLCNPNAVVKNIASTKTYFTSFVHKWEEYFGSALTTETSTKALKNPETAGAAFAAYMEAVEKKLPEWETVPVTSYHVLSIQKGSNAENPSAGAKATVEFDKNAKTDFTHPVLSKAMMQETLTSIQALLAEVDNLTKDFGKYRDNLNTLRKVGLGQSIGSTISGKVAKEQAHKDYLKETADAGKALQGLARLGMDGLSKSVPAVLDVVRANLTYVNKSAGAHSKAKSAEKETA